MARKYFPAAFATLAVAAIIGGSGGITRPVAEAVRASRSSADSAVVSGTVVNAVSLEPIARAAVTLEGEARGSEALGRQFSDTQGRFVFRNLAAGSYHLAASIPGYFAGGHGSTAPDVPLSTFRLAEGQWLKDVRVALCPPASLRGAVFDEAGEPVAGAHVQVLLRFHLGGLPRLASGPAARTDDRGEYSISNLTAGEYLVLVAVSQPTGGGVPGVEGSGVKGGRPGASIPWRSSDGARQSMCYAPLYYPASLTAREAVPIALGFGESRQGVDLHLVPSPARRVAGRLRGPRGALDRLTLRLVPVADVELGSGTETAMTTADAEGRFAFPAVPGGTYVVEAAPLVTQFVLRSSAASPLGRGVSVPPPPGFKQSELASLGSGPGVGIWHSVQNDQGGGVVWGRELVAVEDGDVSDVVVPLARASALRGSIRVDDTFLRVPKAVIVEAEPTAASVSAAPRHVFVALQAGEGTFELDGLLPGEYCLRAAVLGETPAAVRSIWAGGRDYSEEPFDTSAGADFLNVVMTITAKVGRVSGMVRDSDGRGTADAVVAHFPIEPERRARLTTGTLRIGSSTVTADGTYTIPALPAGEYYVVAIPRSQRHLLRDSRFLAAAALEATRLRIRWGEVQVLDLRRQEVDAR